MPNMRDIRTRMKSIGQTLQITGAMKLISTAKLRRARTQLLQTEPYFDKIRETMNDIVCHGVDVQEEYFGARTDRVEGIQRAILVITSDKGLAGGFNHNIIKLAEESFLPGKSNYLILLGNIGWRHFTKTGIPILETYRYSTSVPTVYEAKDIAEFALDQYNSGTIDEFYVVYTRMYSSVKLVPEAIKVFPLELGTLGEECRRSASSGQLNYSPSPKAVLETLIPKYIAGVIYGAMVENFASEHSARMAAMDNATKNAQEMLDGLRLQYNRLRQSAITQEVTEIVAGAAALNA